MPGRGGGGMSGSEETREMPGREENGERPGGRRGMSDTGRCQTGGRRMPGREEKGCQAGGSRGDTRQGGGGMPGRGRRDDANRGRTGTARQGRRGRRRSAAGRRLRKGLGAAQRGSLTCSPGTPARSTAARSPLGARLGPAPAPLQPGAGEAQGASEKSEELNNELGIRAGSVAPSIRMCDHRAGSIAARPDQVHCDRQPVHR